MKTYKVALRQPPRALQSHYHKSSINNQLKSLSLQKIITMLRLNLILQSFLMWPMGSQQKGYALQKLFCFAVR
jgi:hypothetical protein